jgi:hypothetical protein
MDSRPVDEMLLLAVAGRDMGAVRALYERHAGWLAIRLRGGSAQHQPTPEVAS